MAKQTILIVDDEIDNVEALERIFRLKYKVLKATSGRQALQILDQHPDPIATILTDQRMPEMTGAEFLGKTLDKFPDTTRLLLTGYTDIDSVISAVNSGQIYRYLTKPWDPVDLEATMDRAVERFLMTRELKEKNEALAIALSDLQTLDKAKTQFMILVNHELKTPLTSIMSFSELLKETPLNEEQQICVQRVYKSSLRLKHLIDDVLLVVSGETKTLKMKPQPFDAHLLQPSLGDDVNQILKQKNQIISYHWPEKRIVGDQVLLNQVFHRLIHNAAKFGKDKSEIKIDCEMVTPHRARFSVHNEGSSIAPNVIEKILRPFFIDEDVMNHSTGMGLGLTICQTILKNHNSGLNIENASGGVLVSFELPCL